MPACHLTPQVGLAIKSLLDTVDVWDQDDQPVADDNSNLFQRTTTAAPTGATRGGSAAAGVSVPSTACACSCTVHRPAAFPQVESMGGGFSCAGAGVNQNKTPGMQEVGGWVEPD